MTKRTYRVQLGSITAIILALAILLVVPVSATFWDANDKAIGFWKFDENTGTLAKESILGINNGTLRGTTTWYPVGKINSAIGRFKVSGEAVNLTSTSAYNINHYDNFSVSFWANFSILPADSGIITKDDGVANKGWLIKGGSGTLQFYLIDTWATSYFQASFPNALIGDGKWRHYVLTYNGTGANTGVSLYVNGTSVAQAGSGSAGVLADTTDNFESVTFGNYKDAGVQSHPCNCSLDEVGMWNRTLSQSDVNLLYNEYSGMSYGTFTTLNFPANNFVGFSRLVTLNCSSYFVGDSVFSNITLQLNHLSGSQIVRSSVSTSIQADLQLAIRNYTWLCMARDTNNVQYNSTLRYLNISPFIENSQAFNQTVYETSNENFVLNVTYDSTYYSAISANLVYNGTSYTSTKIGSGDNLTFSRTIAIPSSAVGANTTFYWAYQLTNSSGNFKFNSTFKGHAVIPIYFNICNSTLNTPFINFTFKDESTLATMVANITSSTFYYWLSEASNNKSLSFTDLVGNTSNSFCFSPINRTLNILPYIQYSSTSYPQRTYNPSAFSINNVTTNKTLYLLSSTTGLYVTFQIINAAEIQQPLAGVFANVTRNNEVVGSGTTGWDGGITFWMNPDNVHTACFSLDPYPQFCLTQAFTQSSYTISLEGTISSNVSDYFRGVSYSILPSALNYLSNNTVYSFNLTLSSSYWSLDSWGFNITNENVVLAGDTSSTAANGGILNLDIDTALNETFTITYYWIINGTRIAASKSWTILDLSDSSYSISHFISDFKSYIATGFFGLDDFGLGIICFVVILVITGTLKVKSGITDETTLLGVIFSLVALFDIGFELIPNPIGAVPHFPTILMAVIFSGFIWKEVFQ